MNDEFETSTGGTPEIPQAAPIPEPTPIPDPVPMAAPADPTPTEPVEPEPIEPGPVEPEPAEPETAVDAPVTQPPVQPDPQYPNPFAQPTPPVYNPAQPVQPTPPVYNPAQPVQPTAPVYNPAQPVQPTAPVYNPAQPVQPTPPVYNPAQPTYTPPQYTPQYGAYPPQYGQYPPQPPVPPYTPGAYARPNPVPPKKSDGKVGRILMWIAAALIEAVIVGFAIYGVYALCRGDAAPVEPNRPPYSQGDNRGPQNPNDDTSSGSTAQNNSKVQMGITCFELPDQYVQAYGIDKGLVVKSFSADSPAKDTELQVGDVITQFNGVRVTSFQSLFDEMEKLDVGDEVTLTCYRMNASGETYQASEPFEVTFRVQARQDAVSSTYPGA